MSIKEEAAKMKLASPLMASAPAEKRNSALLHMIENLEAGKEKNICCQQDRSCRGKSIRTSSCRHETAGIR